MRHNIEQMRLKIDAVPFSIITVIIRHDNTFILLSGRCWRGTFNGKTLISLLCLSVCLSLSLTLSPTLFLSLREYDKKSYPPPRVVAMSIYPKCAVLPSPGRSWAGAYRSPPLSARFASVFQFCVASLWEDPEFRPEELWNGLDLYRHNRGNQWRQSPNSITSICCGFVVQQAVQEILQGNLKLSCRVSFHAPLSQVSMTVR